MSLSIAFQLGITLSEYDDMTPHQLNLARQAFIKKQEYEAEEYQIKLKNQQDLLTIQAYQLSRWVWAKNLTESDVKKALNFNCDSRKNKEMSDNEMLNQIEQLNKKFGGEVRYENGTE